MGIGANIRAARVFRKLTQKELAQLVGVTSSAVTNYENNHSHPKEQILYKLMEVLEVDANFLFADYIVNKDTAALSPAVTEHLDKYNALDERGRENVDGLLDIEYNRALDAK